MSPRSDRWLTFWIAVLVGVAITVGIRLVVRPSRSAQAEAVANAIANPGERWTVTSVSGFWSNAEVYLICEETSGRRWLHSKRGGLLEITK